MARRAVQRQTGDYLRGTFQNCGAGAEPGTEGFLPTVLAPGRITIGFGPPASRGRRLAGANHLFRPDENPLAGPAAATDSVWERGRGNPHDPSSSRSAFSVSAKGPSQRPGDGV